MKILTIILTAFFLLAACREDESSGGEPAVIYDFFRVVDSSTGEDLFINKPTLNPEEVELFMKNRSNEWVNLDLTYTEFDNHTVFGPVVFINDTYFMYKLELPNGDTDTIQVEATGDANYDDVFKFYYNGELNEEYDFTDEEFSDSYAEANSAYSRGELRDLPDENTYIITFEKIVKE